MADADECAEADNDRGSDIGSKEGVVAAELSRTGGHAEPRDSFRLKETGLGGLSRTTKLN